MINLKRLFLLLLCSSFSSIDTKAQMSTDLGKSPQGNNGFNGCMGAVATSGLKKDAISSYKSWADAEYQHEMIDNFVSLHSQYTAARFQVNPHFAYFDDGASPNAFAYFDGTGDGIVRLGGHLVKYEFEMWRRDFFAYCNKKGLNSDKVFNDGDVAPTYSIIAIVAHEMAHILQAKLGVARNSRNNELQADYLAGWQMANYERLYKSQFKEFRVKEDGVRAFFSRGDYAFNSPMHHGTPEQRSEAFMKGFELGDISLERAWNKSMKYRRDLGG